MKYFEKAFEIIWSIAECIVDFLEAAFLYLVTLVLVLGLIKLNLDAEAAFDSQAEALVINVELEGSKYRYPSRFVSYEFEVDGVMRRDIARVEATEYYAIGDVITIEYQSADITKTRIIREEDLNEEKN